jgi:Raf kinase inhibitor-like YbhB/YbcL family protein
MPAWSAHGEARCPGQDRSPELHWSKIPQGSRSLALTVYDTDADFYHWVAYDLPASLGRLSTGATLPRQELGKNSFGEQRYGGPCPPPGPSHHYVFTLYALDVSGIGSGGGLDGPTVLSKIRGHVLGRATLVGRYGSGH